MSQADRDRDDARVFVEAAAKRGEPIRPTHSCFDDALEYLIDALRRAPTATSAGRIFLVHGICVVPETDRGSELAPGQRFAHAWVEDGDPVLVHQAGLLAGERIVYAIARDDWYATMRIETVTRYSPREAAAAARRDAGRSGPWRPEYLAYLRKSP